MLFPIPRPDHASIDLSTAKHLEAKAGSVVIYLGGCALRLRLDGGRPSGAPS